nr:MULTISPECIES: LysR family transcriptional regulator [unclassified Gilliamella]
MALFNEEFSLMKLKFADFTVFIAVARYKNFRAAGNALGLSPSAISHAIKQLEQRLKVQVFKRTTRSVSLTEVGFTLYERLRPAFDEIETILDEVNHFRKTPMGTLKINTAPIFSRLVLIPIVAGFTRQFPDIRVEISTEDQLIDIVQHEFDAGIRLHTTVENDMVTIPIGPKIKMCVVATPNYFTHYPIPTHPYDLSIHKSIVFRYKSGRTYLWEFEKSNEKIEVMPKGNIILDDMDSALKAALCNMGICYTSYEQAKSYLESGELISVLESWLPIRPSLQLYYPRNQYISHSLRTFVDYIKNL